MQQEDGLEHHQSRYPAASLGGSRIRPEKEPAYPTRAHTLRMLGMGERERGGEDWKRALSVLGAGWGEIQEHPMLSLRKTGPVGPCV